jgi:hypothetical protein
MNRTPLRAMRECWCGDKITKLVIRVANGIDVRHSEKVLVGFVAEGKIRSLRLCIRGQKDGPRNIDPRPESDSSAIPIRK